MLYLSSSDVERCDVAMPAIIDLVELALAEHGHGRTEMPPKLGIHPQPGTLLHAMPAWVSAAQAAGMKWVGAFPQNVKVGLPAVMGLIVLNDPATGAPLSIMDATWITAARTGASAAVAARALGPKDAGTIAIIGPGVLGRSTVAALREVFPSLKRVRAFAPNRETMQRFARDVEARNDVNVDAAGSVADAVRSAEVVVTAAPWPRPGGTPSVTREVLKGVRFCCALDLDGSLAVDAVAAADRFFADDVATFELHRERGVFRDWPKPAELANVVAGKTLARQRPDEQLVCANLGLGIYDVVIARRVFEVARERGIGTELPA